MRAQQGFALLELTAAVLIATLIAIWASGAVVNRMNDAAAQASAVWMLTIRKATQSYIQRYAPVLLAASGMTALAHKGYADWTNPSLPELKGDGLLSPGFPEQAMRGLSASIRLMRAGDCPGDTCRIDALIHTDQALLDSSSGKVNEQMVAQWLLAAQGWGGAVTALRPGYIRGASFEFSNPPVAGTSVLPAGTVALAVTAMHGGDSDYLRVKDPRDPLFQGQATIKGDLNAQASLHVQDYLSIGALEVANTSCTTVGLVAREAEGGLLVCRNNEWMSAGGRGGGGFSLNSAVGCSLETANPLTGVCSCPLGFGAVRISDSGSLMAPEGRTRGYLCVG